MPGFNGTGPDGQGSKTGRGLGKCNPKKTSTDSTERVEPTTFCRGAGRGQGRRAGFGRGRR